MIPWAMRDACDCHSHVFGPYGMFPLAPERTFDPSESPVERLEAVWQESGIERAVLVQGSAHGGDHRALLAAIARDPERRRGVALLKSDIDVESLAGLHEGGIRAVRFNWIGHLLAKDGRSEADRLTAAAGLLEKVARLGWHVELHLDPADLALATRLSVPAGMKVVIDHMARLDGASSNLPAETTSLLRLLERGNFWVKLSGADRICASSDDLQKGIATIRELARTVPDRCVWGLDWPHVNLARKRSDQDLVEALSEAIGDKETLTRILVSNPEALYGFEPSSQD